MDITNTLEHAISSYSFVLPMSGTRSTAEWAELIEQHFDQADRRHREVVMAIRSCPTGSVISRSFGGSRISLRPARRSEAAR